MFKSEKKSGISERIYHLYWEDGIIEIFQGIFFIFYAEMLIKFFTASGTVLFQPPFIVFMPLFIFLPVVLKRKLVYPRLGVFEFEYRLGSFYFIGVVLPLAFIPLSIFILKLVFSEKVDIDLILKWIPAVYGVLIGGVFYDQLKRAGSKRFYIYSFFFILYGLTISLLEFDMSKTRIFMFFMAISLIMLIRGSLHLFRFVKKYSVIKTETENG
jgi:hypothetical protein